VPARRDPFKNYSFLVEIDGIASSAFKSVSGLAAEAEVIEYREGSAPFRPHASSPVACAIPTCG
jgi:phage tail-like protein